MELTAAAQGLNAFFFGYDSALLGALHSVAEGVGVVMTPMMKLITLLGEKGLIFFLLALVFLCFARSRDLGALRILLLAHQNCQQKYIWVLLSKLHHRFQLQSTKRRNTTC